MRSTGLPRDIARYYLSFQDFAVFALPLGHRKDSFRSIWYRIVVFRQEARGRKGSGKELSLNCCLLNGGRRGALGRQRLPLFRRNYFVLFVAFSTHGILRRSALRFILLNSFANVLSHQNPIRCQRLCVRFGRRIASVVFIELTEKVKYTRRPRTQRWLCKEKVGFYFFTHGTLNSYIG